MKIEVSEGSETTLDGGHNTLILVDHTFNELGWDVGGVKGHLVIQNLLIGGFSRSLRSRLGAVWAVFKWVLRQPR